MTQKLKICLILGTISWIQISSYACSDIEKETLEKEGVMISKSQAYKIAEKYARRVYRDLSMYEVKIILKEGNWHVDYEFKNKKLDGGGPHFVISGKTGEIINYRFEQ